jgi:hypothetical protein
LKLSLTISRKIGKVGIGNLDGDGS